MSSFTDIKLNYGQYEFYFPRKEILSFISENLVYLKGDLLDVGCGKKPYKQFILENKDIKSYVGLDIENSLDYGGEKPEIFWHDDKIPADDNTFHSAIATEVFEHINNIREVISEIHRVMAPGSNFMITVPFIWPLHETPHDHFRYTPFALQKILTDAGLRIVKIQPMGGWNAALGMMIALWTKRAFKKKLIKIMLFLITFPVVWLLFKTDKKPTAFTESTMITGLGMIVQK